MRIEDGAQEQKFEPVTITIESVEELNFFRDVLGDTGMEVEETYGLPNLYPLFCKIDDIFDKRGIKRVSPMDVKYERVEKE